MNSLKSQRGALDLVIGILLVGLLVLGGVYFYYKHQSQLAADAAKLANQATQQTVKKGKPADPTAKWTSLANADAKFTLKYNPTWKTLVCADNKMTTYMAPTSAALAKCNSGYTGQMYVLSAAGDQRTSFDASMKFTDKAATNVTVAGVAGTRTTATVDMDGPLGPVKGTKMVEYLFFTGGKTYQAFYQQTPSGDLSTNVLSDFDLMVKNTLKFN